MQVVNWDDPAAVLPEPEVLVCNLVTTDRLYGRQGNKEIQ